MNIKTDITGAEFRLQYLSIEDLVSKFSRYERRDGKKSLCTPGKARFIESVLVGIPQKPVFVDGSDRDLFIFEGEERIKAFVDFCSNGMALSNTYFRTILYENKTINDFPISVVQTFLSTKVPLYVLNPGVRPFVRYGAYLSVKQRVTSDSRKSARSHLFPNYLLIEDFVCEFRSRNKSVPKASIIEELVCNSFVAYMLQTDFSINLQPCHLDVVSNAFLQSEEFPKMFENIQSIGMLSDVLTHSLCLFDKQIDEKINTYMAINILLVGKGKKMMSKNIFNSKWKQLPQSLKKKNDFVSYRERIIKMYPSIIKE